MSSKDFSSSLGRGKNNEESADRTVEVGHPEAGRVDRELDHFYKMFLNSGDRLKVVSARKRCRKLLDKVDRRAMADYFNPDPNTSLKK